MNAGLLVRRLPSWIPGCHWWDIILTNSAEEETSVSLARFVTTSSDSLSNANSIRATSSYLQSLQCRPHYRPLLWRWRRSLFGSCAPPSALSWHSAAPLLWSPHRRPCQTNQRSKAVVSGVRARRGGGVGLGGQKAQPSSWEALTSLKASFNSFTPIIPDVSAKSFGAMRSTKSSKSTLPPTSKARGENATFSLCHQQLDISAFWKVLSPPHRPPATPPPQRTLTVHVDVLAQFNQLHLCRHVAHRPHQITQVLTADQSILVFIELIERIAQLFMEGR